jgi:hypothetical protein
LQRRFEQLAAGVVSCGYFWVLASRGRWMGLGALAMRQIGKLEDLPRTHSPIAPHVHDLKEYSRREIHVKKVS